MAQSLQDLVGRVFRDNRRTEHVALVTLQKQWPSLVGTGLAERSWPSRLQQGVLWITAPDSSWAYQLQFLKQDFFSGIRLGLPDLSLNEIRFKVGALPPKATRPIETSPAGSAGPWSAEPSPAAQEVPVPELERASSAIGDPTLRDAFRRAMTKQLRRHTAKP